MKTLLFTLVNLLLLTTTTIAQDDCNKWALGMHYNLISPLTHLNRNGYKMNHGGNVELFYLGLGESKVKIQPGLKLNLGTTAYNKEAVLLEVPENTVAYAHSHNLLLDVTGSVRFILPTDYLWSFYGDLNLGARHTWARETIRLDDNDDEFENTATDYHKTTSTLYGVNLGLLIPLSDKVDLDLRGNYESCVRMNHFDLNNASDYSLVETYNPSDIGIEIGIRIKLSCAEKYENDYKRNDYNNTRNKSKTKVVRKTTRVKT